MGIVKRWITCILVALALPAIAQQPDLVLKGDVQGAQNKTYFEIPFTCPPVCTVSVLTFNTAEEISAPPWTLE